MVDDKLATARELHEQWHARRARAVRINVEVLRERDREEHERGKRDRSHNGARLGIATVRPLSAQYLPFPGIQKSAKTSRSSLRQLNTGRPRAGVKGLFKRQRP